METEVTTIPRNEDRSRSLEVSDAFSNFYQRSSVFERLNVSKRVYDNFTLNISEFHEFDKMIATDVNTMTAHVKNEYMHRVCTRSGSAKRRANFFKNKLLENRGQNNLFFTKMGFQKDQENIKVKKKVCFFKDSIER